MQITELTPHIAALDELGRRLTLARKHQRLTQAELAAQAGLGVATVIRIESGQDAQLSSWVKIMSVLGMTQALDTLLPADIRSPMIEVKKSGAKVRPAKVEDREQDLASSAKTIWGDGKS